MPGAISGPLLGEAAHRLLKNSLQIYSNGSGLLDPPYRNSPNIMNNRPRPAGPSGYERGFTQDYLFAHDHYPRGNPNSRSGPPFNESNRQNLRMEERLPLQERYHNLRSGFSNMTIEEGSRFRNQAGMMQPRMPNTLGFNQMYPQQHPQTSGPPPRPPANWIDKPVMMIGNAAMYHKQETFSLAGGGNEKQVRKVYQARSRSPQNPSDSGLPQ